MVMIKFTLMSFKMGKWHVICIHIYVSILYITIYMWYIHRINKNICFLLSKLILPYFKHYKIMSLRKIIKINGRNYPGYFEPFSSLQHKERRGRRSAFSCDLNTVLPLGKGVDSHWDQWNSFYQIFIGQLLLA